MTLRYKAGTEIRLGPTMSRHATCRGNENRREQEVPHSRLKISMRILYVDPESLKKCPIHYILHHSFFSVTFSFFPNLLANLLIIATTFNLTALKSH